MIAVDVSPQALELARRFGAVACVTAASPEAGDAAFPRPRPVAPCSRPTRRVPASAAGEGTRGRCRRAHQGADLRAAPMSRSTRSAAPGRARPSIESLRRRGRHVQIGLLPGLTALPMGRVIGYELELLGSHGMAAHAYPAMLEAVPTASSGRTRCSPVPSASTRRVPPSPRSARVPGRHDDPADAIGALVRSRNRLARTAGRTRKPDGVIPFPSPANQPGRTRGHHAHQSAEHRLSSHT